MSNLASIFTNDFDCLKIEIESQVFVKLSYKLVCVHK